MRVTICSKEPEHNWVHIESVSLRDRSEGEALIRSIRGSMEIVWPSERVNGRRSNGEVPPWEVLGFSERTYRRRKAEGKL